MKIIAAIVADLDTSPIASPSRLAQPLGHVPILRRTVARILQVNGLESIHVLTLASQHDRAAALLEGLPVEIHRADWPIAPHQQMVTIARKWALDNWRGGIGGSCSFDESFHPAGLAALAAMVKAEALMVVPAHAALLNVGLAQKMLDHFQQHGQQYRMTFAQSPPGLTPLFVTASLLSDLEPVGYPPGMLLAYNPKIPEPDMIGKPVCYATPTTVACTCARLLADTAESFALCQAAIDALGETLIEDAMALCRFVANHRSSHVPTLPSELEIELTAQDALPNTTLRPRGQVVPARGPLDMDLLDNVLRQLSKREDARVVFGGFGDPLAYPHWSQAIRLARQANIFGISVHTAGKQLALVGADAILTEPPDILVVWLDAASEEVYQAVHGEPGCKAAADAIVALEQGRRQREQVKPLIVPAMTKTSVTVQDLESFVDTWIRAVGACWVDGYSDRAGQCERRQVASMAPPGRASCLRIRSRLLMLSDGQAVACDQDFKAVQAVGNLIDQTLADIWAGDRMRQLRDRVPGDGETSNPLCVKCQEWGRP